MPSTNKAAQSIDIIFRAMVIADTNSGWPCVQMPESAEFFGTGRSVKVGGTVDGHAMRQPCCLWVQART
jgi:hypothetical protein